MSSSIQIGDRDIIYVIKKSKRVKRLRISVSVVGDVTVTIPATASKSVAIAFLTQKSEWLLERLAYFDTLEPTRFARFDRDDYLKHREDARKFVTQRLEELNQRYGYGYNKIAIRDQKTCWGSCSARKNLNFNYKIIFLPAELQDYVLVHELCHLKELNHSRKFWDLVAGTVPNYLECKKELQKML